MNIIAVDNGVTGAIAILNENKECVDFFPTPTKKTLNYQKKKSFVNRIDTTKLAVKLLPYYGAKAVLERPLVNPGRFAATASALRALEATLIVLEQLDISYEFIDSKEWQKKLLPSGLKGPELKEASASKSIQLFPKWKDEILRQKDGDALLIALSRL